MNIAFPAIFVFLIVLPGFIFHSAFRITEREALDYSPFSAVFVRGVVTAAFLQALWVWLSHTAFDYHIDFQAIMTLMVGQKDELLKGAIAVASSEPRLAFCYFSSIYIFSWSFGRALRAAAVKFGWDEHKYISEFVKFDIPWYYLFRGRKGKNPYAVIVSAIVELDPDYIYTGYLFDYFPDKEGNLDRLVLEFAERRQLSKDRSPGETEEDRFYEIDGDYLVLRYSEIKTLNVKIVKLEETPIIAKNHTPRLI